MYRLTLLVMALVAAPSAAADPPAFTKEQVAFFEKEVEPILKKNCLKCHGAEEKIKGGLRLTSRAEILKGGDTGPAVDLAKPAESLLVQAIEYKKDGYEMPPGGKQLPEADRAVLAKWVREGLPWTPGAAAAPPAPHTTGGIVTPEARQYWAYQPVKRPEIPRLANTGQSGWQKNPIDAFLFARLKAKGLTPNGPADKVALVRRVYYDLWGLPPTPEQVDAFVADSSPTAFEKLVDSLLASPHYGEKWGRHWLDLVRYAETNGYERDGPKPNAWRYRDYVIRSFNADKPFDQFLKEQIAGDELWPGKIDATIATGYYRLGVWDDEPADDKQALFDGYDDIVATTGQVFLGMTLNCARCHDHKKDPIPQADYYKLVAFVRDVRPYSDTRDVKSKNNMTDVTPPEKRSDKEAEEKGRRERADAIRAEMKPLEDAAIKKMPPEDQLKVDDGKRAEVLPKVPQFLARADQQKYARLKRELDDLAKKPFSYQEFALSVANCDPRPPKTHVMVRGNPHVPGKEVAPGFPEVLGVPAPSIPEAAPGAKTSGRRTVLANWLASPDNPLTARVFVNRVWQYHFGRGLVPSPNDFGKLGEGVTHPELLDWLASEFVAGGWQVKKLHKLMLLSAAYRMSSTGTDAGLKEDPGNQLFWRFPMRRLGAEEVRDSMLAVSGSLNETMYGPSVYPKIPKEVLAGQSVPGQGWPTTTGPEANRRSVYVHVKRSLLVPVLNAHDAADTDTSCPVRYTTTVPTQALGMLNGEFANERAVAFAQRLMKESPEGLAVQVTRAIRLTTGRVPLAEEVARDVAFVQSLQTKHGLDATKALTQYALLCLNANEFVYLD